MHDKLIILLKSTDLETLSWVILRQDGSMTAETHGSASVLADLQKDKTIIVLVPAEDVLLTSVELPAMSRSRLLQALPFALEDQLVADIEGQHIVPLGSQQDGRQAVAVVTHDKMQQWLGKLQESGVTPDYMLPVTLALPYHEGDWCLCLHDLAVVRTGKFAGYAGDIAAMPVMLKAVPNQPSSILITSYSGHQVDQSVAMLGAQVVSRESSQYLTDLANNLVTMPDANLLQGRYVVRKSKHRLPKHMEKIMLGAAIAWVALLVAFPMVSYMLLNSQLSASNMEIAAIYHQVFPQASSVVAPKMRMEAKLREQGGSQLQSPVLRLASDIGKAMAQAPGIHLRHLEYSNHRVMLKVDADSSASFNAFTGYLKQEGLVVKQQHATLAGVRVDAVVEVS